MDINENIQERDYLWFLDNYQELFNKYGCSFLVIKKQKIIGSFKTYAEGVRTTSKTEELGTFIVQYCDGKENAYTNYISSMSFLSSSEAF